MNDRGDSQDEASALSDDIKPGPPPSSKDAELPSLDRRVAINEKTVDALNRFADAQAKQVEVRLRELELSNKELDSTHEYSTKSLELQHNHLKEERSHKTERFQSTIRWSFWTVVILCVFFLIAIFMGQGTLVKEFAEHALGIIIGGWAGYQYGFRKGGEKESSEK
jgi:hypothetical protein